MKAGFLPTPTFTFTIIGGDSGLRTEVKGDLFELKMPLTPINCIA